MDDLLATSQYTGPFPKFSTSFQSFVKKLGDAKSKVVSLIECMLDCHFFSGSTVSVWGEAGTNFLSVI